ncbi:glycosyltransferase family 2 protein [Acidiphilium sp.]|uniref:glycosyltransferase family 2 protein n=1 Tax=Acidiphilium sp. TaxID=527 RepID=UPI003CFF5C08
MKPLAVLCKFYNEPDYLPLWRDHYARQVGIDNCYLLDHGSNDGSERLTGGAHVIRLPRSAQDDNHHLALIRQSARELLKRYRYVLHVDSDEFVVCDPHRAPDLAAYAAQARHELITAIGLQVQHVADREAPLCRDEPVLAQRGHVWFSAAMCKPALTSGPLDWSPGFHCMAQPIVFDDLYLFHLRHFDRDIGFRRLQRSRAQPWSHPEQAAHQRLSDVAWREQQDGFGAVQRLSDIPAEAATPAVRMLMDAVIASRAGRESCSYRIDLGLRSEQLWRIPDRFRAIF